LKLPRDVSGSDLAKSLGRLGYQIVRQEGSHIRLSSNRSGIQHHLTIPAHSPLKVGTLSAILQSVCEHQKLSRTELIKLLF